MAQGGFLPEMTKREAAQILGTRESAGEDRIREAHLRIMKANHPDLGGSSYLAEKVMNCGGPRTIRHGGR
jgi:DnaJ family protein C protein 19